MLETGAPAEFVERYRRDPKGTVAELRRRAGG